MIQLERKLKKIKHKTTLGISKRVLCLNDSRRIMGLLSRKKEIIVGNICPKCNMEFSDSQRTLRHMEKAHQSKKKFECNSCG